VALLPLDGSESVDVEAIRFAARGDGPALHAEARTFPGLQSARVELAHTVV
jgi:hypothetical protein